MSETGKEAPEIDIEREINGLIEHLDRIKDVVTNFKKKGRDNYTTSMIKVSLDYVTMIWECGLKRYAALKEAVPNSRREEFDFFKLEFMRQAEQQFFEVKDYLTAELSILAATQERFALSVAQQISHPGQSLPKFGGDPRSWTDFEELFTSAVVNNKLLSDSQRLQYLNDCLEGEVLALIQPLKFESFEESWETVKRQFGKPSKLVTQLLDSIFYLKPIREGDLASLQQVTVDLKLTLVALEKLHRPVGHWGDLLVALVKKHLNRKLTNRWKVSVKHMDEYPSFSQMLEFLEDHVIMAWNYSQSQSQLRDPTTVNETSTAVPKACIFCRPHKILNCANFRRLTPKDRFRIIQKNQCCTICLGTGHTAARCQSSTVCEKCSERHHTLLHFETLKKEARRRRRPRHRSAKKAARNASKTRDVMPHHAAKQA